MPDNPPTGTPPTDHVLAFEDPALFQTLMGPQNATLTRIEEAAGVSMDTRGNEVTIHGQPAHVAVAESALRRLYDRLGAGTDIKPADIEPADIDAAVRLSRQGLDPAQAEAMAIRARKKPIQPRNAAQADYIAMMREKELVFGLGPAGTGKTKLAVAMAVENLIDGRVDRLVLSRPAVEAGERLGFLPGDLREKLDPYLRPLYDSLQESLPGDQVKRLIETGVIEVAPLAYMRGRTLANAFVILDEAQNTTPVQMKMFLTRLGENARMVITGDMSQVDLPSGTRSGLRDALSILRDEPAIGVTEFSERDVVRHGLVTRIVQAYDARDRARRDGRHDDDGQHRQRQQQQQGPAGR